MDVVKDVEWLFWEEKWDGNYFMFCVLLMKIGYFI